MAPIIDGQSISAQMRERVAEQVAALRSQHEITPGLAVVLVGENPASQVYVKNKIIQTANAGMNSYCHRLSAEVSEEELLDLVEHLNADPSVNGILVQLPLPDQIDSDKVISMIDPNKDVDGFHVMNAGRLTVGLDGLVPCTPVGCIILLKSYLNDLTGCNAVIVGRSNIVGKPLAALLLREHCTVTIAHSRTRNLAQVCREADILVAAVGRPGMVKGDWIKPGSTVIDVGINRIEGNGGKTRLVGDVDYQEASEVAGAITPVPGGVGPMTIACLLQNTLRAACLQNDIQVPHV
ncbi:MAG: bifunctional methylenetetrahydrofolate dehydrogenase/methenyltetrahydrofolate cyclohydrolase FolD [Gammaproteobacteria bacterium]|nr:bifunctional methylenetetrahydrofolate dehydrogenase/methenyltetrahydrofolate cyclohydrolase FolD [Gammaproteobacteria bacterium]